MASTAALQAALLTAPGGTYFSSPLSVALGTSTEEPACRAALLGALDDLAASPAVQLLAQPGAPDQQPETALVSIASSAARHLAPIDAVDNTICSDCRGVKMSTTNGRNLPGRFMHGAFQASQFDTYSFS